MIHGIQQGDVVFAPHPHLAPGTGFLVSRVQESMDEQVRVHGASKLLAWSECRVLTLRPFTPLHIIVPASKVTVVNNDCVTTVAAEGNLLLESDVQCVAFCQYDDDLHSLDLITLVKGAVRDEPDEIMIRIPNGISSRPGAYLTRIDFVPRAELIIHLSDIDEIVIHTLTRSITIS